MVGCIGRPDSYAQPHKRNNLQHLLPANILSAIWGREKEHFHSLFLSFTRLPAWYPFVFSDSFLFSSAYADFVHEIWQKDNLFPIFFLELNAGRFARLSHLLTYDRTIS